VKAVETKVSRFRVCFRFQLLSSKCFRFCFHKILPLPPFPLPHPCFKERKVKNLKRNYDWVKSAESNKKVEFFFSKINVCFYFQKADF